MAPSSTTASPALAMLVLYIWVLGAHSTSPLEMAECGAQLLLLAPCAPFVQGLMPAPVKSCCDDLVDLNSQQPQCLCLVLNGTSSFPINQTLALRLPPLCGLSTDTFACPGLVHDDHPPAANSQPKVLNGGTPNSSVAEVPMSSLHPRSTLTSRSENAARITQAWAFALIVSSVIIFLLQPLW